MVYRMVSAWTMTQTQLEEVLETARFAPCGASQEKSVGWIEPRGQAHGALVEVIDGQWMLRQMVETKAVPGSVVKRKVEERAQQIEASTGRKPGKKEKRELAEDARQSLLPMAFTKQSNVLVWIDPANARLTLDAGSQTKADETMTALVSAIDGLAVQLIDTQTSPAVAMAEWLSTHEAPAGFSVDRECELKAPDESRAVVRYTRHALDTDEVSQHIAMGKVPTRLALTWNDRVSFVLTEQLQVKKLAFLDILKEDAERQSENADDLFAANFTLMCGELSQLLAHLMDVLGGEGE